MTNPFLPLIPELSVFDLEESKAFYLGVLGFCVEYERPKERFAFLSRGEVQLMIEQIHDEGWNVGELVYPLGRGVNFSLEVDDIGVLYRRVLDHGVIPFRSLRTSEYQTMMALFLSRSFLSKIPAAICCALHTRVLSSIKEHHELRGD